MNVLIVCNPRLFATLLTCMTSARARLSLCWLAQPLKHIPIGALFKGFFLTVFRIMGLRSLALIQLTNRIQHMATDTPVIDTPVVRDAKSHPYFTQKLNLHSLHAQQVFDRGFEIYSNAVFSLSVVLRIVGSDEQASEVEKIVDERLSNAVADIQTESTRLDKLAESNGVSFEGVSYSNPKQVEAKISSPRSARYVGLITEFDVMIAKLDVLWLSGQINDSHYSRAIYEWKRRLLRLAGGIRTLSVRAMIAARKKAQEAAQKKGAGEKVTEVVDDELESDEAPLTEEELLAASEASEVSDAVDEAAAV